MPKPPTGKPGKKHLSAEQRRALELLASIPQGATEALLLAYGFRREMLAKLVLTGFASVATETMRAGGQTMKVERYRITDAGRMAVEG
jgi:hypothetical protein